MAFDGGIGVLGDPYLVSTAAQLDEVRNNLSAHYLQTADIDLVGYANWVPIGGTQDWDNYFTGTYDGGHFKISNLTVVGPTLYMNGLFGGMDQGTLKNIELYAVNVTGKGYTGALIGYSRDCTITDCYAYGGTVTCTGYGIVGGLIGECWSQKALPTLISDCGTTVDVNVAYSVENGSANAIGGFIGDFGTNYSPSPTMLLTRCYATGNVLTPEWTVASGRYATDTGGFVGNIGSVLVDAVKITECYATGNVRCDYEAGGFIGRMNKQSTIRDCYATGAVYGSLAAEATVSKLGGFVGCEYGFASAGYGLNTIERCYAIGPVCENGSAATHTLIGAFVGEYLPLDSTIIRSSYFDNTTAQQTDVVAVGKTTAQLQNAATFAGWNFGGIWASHSDYNSGYPIFVYQYLGLYHNVAHYIKQNGTWVAVSEEETIALADISDFEASVNALIEAALTAAVGGSY